MLLREALLQRCLHKTSTEGDPWSSWYSERSSSEDMARLMGQGRGCDRALAVLPLDSCAKCTEGSWEPWSFWTFEVCCCSFWGKIEYICSLNSSSRVPASVWSNKQAEQGEALSWLCWSTGMQLFYDSPASCIPPPGERLFQVIPACGSLAFLKRQLQY